MKYFSGLLEILDADNKLINSVRVQALAKRNRHKSGAWQYTIRTAFFNDLDDAANKSVIVLSHEDWLDAVKSRISKESEHDNVRFFLFREIKL